MIENEYESQKALLYTTLGILPSVSISIRSILVTPIPQGSMSTFDINDMVYPVVLALDEVTGIYTILDGRHRVHYARTQGVPSIVAKVVPMEMLEEVLGIKSLMVQAMESTPVT